MDGQMGDSFKEKKKEKKTIYRGDTFGKSLLVQYLYCECLLKTSFAQTSHFPAHHVLSYSNKSVYLYV